MTNPRLRLLAAFFVLAATSGCSSLDNCPNGSDDPIVIDRPEATDKEALIFVSNPASGPLDPFPVKQPLVFKHDLGVRPYLVKAYLAFVPEGTNGAGGGSVSEVAGNEVSYDCYDSHVIVIKNDTCEPSFFVQLVAAGVPSGDANDDSCGPF